MTTLLGNYKGRKLGALRTRFWQYVHEDGRDHDLPPDECWEWQGAAINGNPVTAINGTLRPSRYVAYALEVEDFESGYHVLAECRNQRCVNPAHLRLAVRRPENDVDAELKAAAQAAVGAAVWQDKTLPQVSTQTCAECGATAADYHHYLGYEPEHWLDVTPLCRKCHRRSEWLVVKETGPFYVY